MILYDFGMNRSFLCQSILYEFYRRFAAENFS